MDEGLRRRLIGLPGLYRSHTLSIRVALAEVATARAEKEARRTELTKTLLPQWTAEKSNETTRKAQVDNLLLEDSVYQAATERTDTAERAIKIAQLDQEALRYELNCLQTVQGWDASERGIQVDYSPGVIASMEAALARTGEGRAQKKKAKRED